MVEWPSPRERKRSVLLNRSALVRLQGEGRERDIELGINDERETPHGARDHLYVSAFGFVTGGVTG